MWLPSDFVSSGRFIFVVIFLTTIAILPSEANTTESENNDDERQALSDQGYAYGGYRGFGGYIGYGGYGGYGGYQGYGSYGKGDGTASGGSPSNVGGQVVGSQLMVTYPGAVTFPGAVTYPSAATFAGPRYIYNYPYQHGHYFPYGYGGYGYPVYVPSSSYLGSACPNCFVTPPTSEVDSSRGAPAPPATPSPSQPAEETSVPYYLRVATGQAPAPAVAPPSFSLMDSLESKISSWKISNERAAALIRSRMQFG